MTKDISQLIPIGHKDKVTIREMKNVIYITFSNTRGNAVLWKYTNFPRINGVPIYRCSGSYPGRRFTCLERKAGRDLTLNYPNIDMSCISCIPCNNVVLIKERKKTEKEACKGEIEMVFILVPFPSSAPPLTPLRMQIIDCDDIDCCVAPDTRLCASGKRVRRMIGISMGDPIIISEIINASPY